MKILICTGIYPPAVGGPAYYAHNLKQAFESMGHKVIVCRYGRVEVFLPVLFRHIYFFFKSFWSMLGVEYVIALDTFSVGLPTVLASQLLRKRIVVRIGGDFLWESYVERTHDEITLSNFYKKSLKNLSLKERVIFLATRFVLENVDFCVFSTDWQKNIWCDAYGILNSKTEIIKNEFVKESFSERKLIPKEKRFIWAGRKLFLKNLKRLERIFDDLRKDNQSIFFEIIPNNSS